MLQEIQRNNVYTKQVMAKRAEHYQKKNSTFNIMLEISQQMITYE
jgi:hypothetical protein